MRGLLLLLTVTCAATSGLPSTSASASATVNNAAGIWITTFHQSKPVSGGFDRWSYWIAYPNGSVFVATIPGGAPPGMQMTLPKSRRPAGIPSGNGDRQSRYFVVGKIDPVDRRWINQGVTHVTPSAFVQLATTPRDGPGVDRLDGRVFHDSRGGLYDASIIGWLGDTLYERDYRTARYLSSISVNSQYPFCFTIPGSSQIGVLYIPSINATNVHAYADGKTVANGPPAIDPQEHRGRAFGFVIFAKSKTLRIVETPHAEFPISLSNCLD